MVSGHHWKDQKHCKNVMQCFRNEGLSVPTFKKFEQFYLYSRSYYTKLLPTTRSYTLFLSDMTQKRVNQ